MKERLCELAKEAANNAYSPYSGFKVGAALLCADGSIYIGSNVENASYSVTVCAERNAFLKAVNDGKREFLSIAVAGGREEVGSLLCPPCGVCLQTMLEFCDPKTFKIFLVNDNGCDEYLLSRLIPLGFKNEVLK
jgi:cytidine deaminase